MLPQVNHYNEASKSALGVMNQGPYRQNLVQKMMMQDSSNFSSVGGYGMQSNSSSVNTNVGSSLRPPLSTQTQQNVVKPILRSQDPYHGSRLAAGNKKSQR